MVAVMPKEFRGREGLKRQTFEVTHGPAAVPVPEPPKTAPAPKQATPAQAAQAPLTPPPKKQQTNVPWFLVVGGVVLLVVMAGGAYWLLRPKKEVVVLTPVVPVIPVEPVAPKTPEPEPVKQPEPKPASSPFGDGVYPGKDSDSDGLTDVEEKLYGTNPLRPDTDGDAHIDGNEVYHLYHPNGKDPLRLIDVGLVTRYQPTGAHFALLAITGWPTQSPSPNEFIVRAPTGEAMQVVTEPILPTQSIIDWYRGQIPITQQVELTPDRTKQGFASAWTRDNLTVYVRLSDTELVIFTYQLGLTDRVEYRQTFEMMMNSLERVP